MEVGPGSGPSPKRDDVCGPSRRTGRRGRTPVVRAPCVVGPRGRVGGTRTTRDTHPRPDTMITGVRHGRVHGRGPSTSSYETTSVTHSTPTPRVSTAPGTRPPLNRLSSSGGRVTSPSVWMFSLGNCLYINVY